MLAQLVSLKADTQFIPPLKGRGFSCVRNPSGKQSWLWALQINGATETSTVDSQLVARQCEIEEKYDLSFFDSLVAAPALRLDLGIVSDDRAFDRIPGIVRTPMS
jgi:predicted nucleic acid-binding protein